MEIKFSAHAKYSDGSMSDCRSFKSEKAVEKWAIAQIAKDAGAVITVWKAFSADIHCIYQVRPGSEAAVCRS